MSPRGFFCPTVAAAWLSIVVVAGWASLAHAGDIALTGGAFGAGFSLPLHSLSWLLCFAGIGLWSGLLGGETVWQFPAIGILGALAGGLVAEAGYGLPFAEMASMAGLVVIGLSILFGLHLPVLSPGVLVFTLSLYLGAPLGRLVYASHIWSWLGYGSSTLLGISAGLGLAVMVGRMPLALGLRIFGAGLAGTGILMFLNRI